MYKELVQEAGKALFDDVEGLDKKDVGSLFVGSALVDRLAFQAYPAPLVAEQFGINPRQMITTGECQGSILADNGRGAFF